LLQKKKQTGDAKEDILMGLEDQVFNNYSPSNSDVRLQNLNKDKYDYYFDEENKPIILAKEKDKKYTYKEFFGVEYY